ncbi:MAG: hypothetical protein AB8B53_12475 [Flavobacteriales bacterium]
MDQDKAQLILNLTSFPPIDILEEIIEEEVFQLRDYFLRNPVVGVLYNSRLRKLKQLEEVKSTFLRSNEHSPNIPSFNLIQSKNMKLLFSELERAFTRLRGEMSRGLDPKTIATLAEKMINVQAEYEQKFIELYQVQSKEEVPEVPVKAADQISTGRALILLKQGNSDELSDLLTKEYFRIKGLTKRI